MTTTGEQLNEVLAEWHRLAVAEGKAIREGNWSFVSECQRALCQLRPQIEGLTAKNSRQQVFHTTDHSNRKSATRATVLELIELQRNNLQSLQQRRQRLSAYIESLARTGRRLRGLQRSYAGHGASSWSSYS
jgi:hypothetical protein